MSKIYVDEIAGIASADTVAIPGHVIQVVSVIEDGVGNYTAATQGAVTSAVISASITPTSSSSKILVTGHINGSAESKAHAWWIILQRGGSAIGTGASAGNRRLCHSGFSQYLNNYAESLGHGTLNYLDSPATTSTTTYTVVLGHNSGGSQQFNLNRTQIDGDNNDRPRSASVLTLMEIAG